MEVGITLGASSVSSRSRSPGKPWHLETGHDLSDLRTVALTREESIAARVQRHPPRGCLPRPIRLASESVLGEPERGPRDPSAHELSALPFFPCQHLFPVARKNKIPNFTRLSQAVPQKVGLWKENCWKLRGLEERPGPERSGTQVWVFGCPAELCAGLCPRQPNWVTRKLFHKTRKLRLNININ